MPSKLTENENPKEVLVLILEQAAFDDMMSTGAKTTPSKTYRACPSMKAAFFQRRRFDRNRMVCRRLLLVSDYARLIAPVGYTFFNW